MHAVVGKSVREFITCDLLNISDHLVARFTVSAPLVFWFPNYLQHLFLFSNFFLSAILLLPLNAVKDLGNRTVQYEVVIPSSQ